MASITKRSSGVWSVRWRIDGMQRSRDFARHTDAQALKRELEADRHAGRQIDPQHARMSLSAWSEQWQQSRANLRASTREKNEALYKTHIAPAWAHIALQDITQQSVQAWINRLNQTELAKSTIRSIYGELRICLQAAVDARLIRESPCIGVRLPAVEHTEMQFLDHDQIAKLADAIDPRYRALVLLLAYSGLRIGEATALRRRDVGESVTVRSTAVEVRGVWQEQPPKTRAGRRTVPLPQRVADALAQHMQQYSQPAKDGLVFTSPTGGPLRVRTWRARAFATACKRAGLSVRIHDLRHTAISLWMRAGVDLVRVKTWSGHTSSSFTVDRYGHFFPADDAAILDRLNSNISSKS